MLLRGSNGSGKSVTMQSFIPLLLDGNMRPERLDPFGSRARKMENYLLEENDDRDERTGYLYMEFKRLGSEEYLTLGLGIRARKNKKLESWYFCIWESVQERIKSWNPGIFVLRITDGWDMISFCIKIWKIKSPVLKLS